MTHSANPPNDGNSDENSAENRILVRTLGDSAADLAAWQGYVTTADSATIYHDIAWRDIFGTALEYKSHLLIAEYSATGAVCGALPLYQVPSLFGPPRLVAVPFRDRGGAIFDEPAVFAALLRAAVALKQDLGASCIELKSIEVYPPELAQAAGLVRADHWQHSLVDLTGLTEAKLAKALGAKIRLVRQAERAELVFADRTSDSSAVDVWYQVYQASQRSLGVPPFPRTFFARLLLHFAPTGQARLFVVSSVCGEPLAATIILLDGQAAIYAYSASRPSGRHLRPNDLMLHRLYLWLIVEGRTRFDFGADSPSQDGLLRFKRKWLAKQSPIPFYHLGHTDLTMTDSSAARYNLVRRAVRMTPLPVARHLLAPLVRFFG